MGWIYDIFGTSKNIIDKLNLRGSDKVYEYWETASDSIELNHNVKLPTGDVTVISPNGTETTMILNGEEYDEEDIYLETLSSDRNRLLKYQ